MRAKLIWLLMGSICLILTLAYAALFIVNVEILHKQVRTNLESLGGMLAGNAETALTFDDAEAAEEAIRYLSHDPHVATAGILDTNGKVFASFSRDGGESLALDLPETNGLTYQDDRLRLTVPILADQNHLGTVLIYYDRQQEKDLVRQLWITGLVIMGVLVLLAWLISIRLQAVISRPIHQMASIARRVSEENTYHLRATKHGNDELGKLIDVFNGMLARIQERDADLARHRDILEDKVAARTTELLELNRNLTLAKENAEAGTRSKSEFLANMSHEIRTPLNGIIGMTELALTTDLDEDQRDFLETVQASAASLLHLLNDILDFSKIEAGKMEADPAPFDLRNLLREITAPLAFTAKNKNLDLEFHVADDVPTRLIGDHGRIRQIIVNLVGNALKFTSEGRVDVTVQAPSRHQSSIVLQFSVRDTGIGIPGHKVCLIFEPFSQADGSTTRQYGGTGLGLGISRQLCSLLGGRIWVDTELGVGSTFHFTVRCEVDETIQGVAARNKTERLRLVDVLEGQGTRILLAEDNPINQKLATAILEKVGFEVVVAENGEDAIAMHAQGSVDIILMDVQMPGLSGLDAARTIRENESATGNRVPIIAVTANAMQGDRKDCLSSGMDDYITKPIKTERLYESIESLLCPPPTSP